MQLATTVLIARVTAPPAMTARLTAAVTASAAIIAVAAATMVAAGKEYFTS